MVADKKQMLEKEVRERFITPAILAKWSPDRMSEETQITDGRINLRGNFVVREQPKRADYVLYLAPNKPIAIVEAKDNKHSISFGLQQDFAPLEKTIHKINFAKDDPLTITSHEVYFSLYQQLAGDGENEDEGGGDEAVARFAQLFKPDFFDLVIVDECHRGSAKKDSNWRRILDYFSSATQIGMTATPKETRYISNIDYFGEPIYTYSLREGIDDGFLAPFKVVNVRTDIAEGWRPCKGQREVRQLHLRHREEAVPLHALHHQHAPPRPRRPTGLP